MNWKLLAYTNPRLFHAYCRPTQMAITPDPTRLFGTRMHIWLPRPKIINGRRVIIKHPISGAWEVVMTKRPTSGSWEVIAIDGERITIRKPLHDATFKRSQLATAIEAAEIYK